MDIMKKCMGAVDNMYTGMLKMERNATHDVASHWGRGKTLGKAARALILTGKLFRLKF